MVSRVTTLPLRDIQVHLRWSLYGWFVAIRHDSSWDGTYEEGSDGVRPAPLGRDMDQLINGSYLPIFRRYRSFEDGLAKLPYIPMNTLSIVNCLPVFRKKQQFYFTKSSLSRLKNVFIIPRQHTLH